MSAGEGNTQATEPSAIDAGPQTRITDDPAKLPPPWPAIVADPHAALPAGVAFFERRFVLLDLARMLGAAVFCGCLGLIVLPLGLYSLWDERPSAHADTTVSWWIIGFGFTLLIVSWMCFASLLGGARAIRRQARGEPTRLGLFVADDALLEATHTGYCMIPRAEFVGLADGTLSYRLRGETKSIRLPKRLVRDDPRALAAAIERWAGSAQR